jgi:hypothetical protein
MTRFSDAPCGTPRSPPCYLERRRRCFMAPALGRPLNGKAAPDVRAPLFVVVGILGPFLARFIPFAAVSELRLGIAGCGGYTLAA